MPYVLSSSPVLVPYDLVPKPVPEEPYESSSPRRPLPVLPKVSSPRVLEPLLS